MGNKMGNKMRCKWAAGALALMLAVTTVFGTAAMLPIKANAETIVDGTTTKGSLTIKKTNGTDPLAGAEYKVYKIMSLAEVGGVMTYTPVTEFATTLNGVTADDLGNYSAAELDALVNALAAVAAGQTANGSVITTTNVAGNKISDLDLGYYLVVETAAPAGYVAGKPFLVAIPSTNNYNAETDTEGTTWVYDVTVEPKNSMVSIEKKLGTGEDGTVGLGDFVQFVITTTIPDYTDEGYIKPVFTINDYMSEGLEIQNDVAHPVVVKVAGTEVTGEDKYSVIAVDKENINEADLIIKFTSEYIKSNNGKPVEVTYYAKVTDKAVMGTAGNTNKAILEYSNKPGTGTDAGGNPNPNTTGTKETDAVKVYSFGIKVEKFTKEPDGTATALSGAEFALYEDEDMSVQIGEIKTSGVDGTLTFDRLDEGTYYLKEKKSPAGYTLLTNPIKIKITAKLTDGVANGQFDLEVNGTPVATTTGNFVTRMDANGGISIVAVENHKGFSLPATGGMGVMLFLVIGAAGIIAISVMMTKKTGKRQ